MIGERRPWTRDELILAVNLYCKTPFGRIHMRNPEIIALAKRLGRSVGAVSYKLANFAGIDSMIDRKGAGNVSKLDREVWNEFFENWETMAFESEVRMAGDRLAQQGSSIDDAMGEEDFEFRNGEAKVAEVKVRVNQAFFRRMVLASYNDTCCITGINNVELLNASHIVPWARDERNRLNPANGLCLNALHDRAFDKGLLTLDVNYRVVVCNRVKHGLIAQYAGKAIALPHRFRPSQEFLSFHRENVFLGR